MSLSFNSGEFLILSLFKHFEVMLQVFNCIFQDRLWLIERLDIDEILIVQIQILQGVHYLGHFFVLAGLVFLLIIRRLLRLVVGWLLTLSACLLSFLILSCHWLIIQIYLIFITLLYLIAFNFNVIIINLQSMINPWIRYFYWLSLRKTIKVTNRIYRGQHYQNKRKH